MFILQLSAYSVDTSVCSAGISVYSADTTVYSEACMFNCSCLLIL